jgi:hypothetical protein
MNTKKGGSLASNRVHRLLKGDCKKGGKRSRAKKSKSKSKSKSKKSKRRTKKPKVVKRKKRTRNKKTKKKMKVGGVLGLECKKIIINDTNPLDDLYKNRKAYFTCPGNLLKYFNGKDETFKKAFIGNKDELILGKERSEILRHMKVQAMIYLLGYNNTFNLGGIYSDANLPTYFWPHNLTTGDDDKFISFIKIFKKILTLYDANKTIGGVYKTDLNGFIALAKERCEYYKRWCPDGRKGSTFCKFTVTDYTWSSTVHKRFEKILDYINSHSEFNHIDALK